MKARMAISKETREAVAGAVAPAIIFFGVAVPIILGVLIWPAPNPVIAKSGAGWFISGVSSTGRFFTSGVTTAQTTCGSIAVYSQFSALRNQQLTVERASTATSVCVWWQHRVYAQTYERVARHVAIGVV